MVSSLTMLLCRQLFERRLEISDPAALRIERVRHTEKKGVTTQGCPIAKWVSSKGD